MRNEKCFSSRLAIVSLLGTVVPNIPDKNSGRPLKSFVRVRPFKKSFMKPLYFSTLLVIYVQEGGIVGQP